MANISGNFMGLKSQTLDGDSTFSEQYINNRSNEEYYFSKNALIQFKFGDDRFNFLNQLIRYTLLPEPVLSLNYSNNKYYIKKIAVLLMVISSITTLFFLIIILKKRN